jgi:hypothetical protein
VPPRSAGVREPAPRPSLAILGRMGRPCAIYGFWCVRDRAAISLAPTPKDAPPLVGNAARAVWSPHGWRGAPSKALDSLLALSKVRCVSCQIAKREAASPAGWHGVMLKARTLLGVLMATLAVVGKAAVAGPFEDAVVAHERGDYATAMRLSRPLAEQGDPRAQLMLGILLDEWSGRSPRLCRGAPLVSLGGRSG